MLNRADKVKMAIQAIKAGRTRGQFIREHTGHDSSKHPEKCLVVCQWWSDAYTQAMKELEVRNAE